MAQNDPRRVVRVSTNTTKDINLALQQICEMIYQQEGRRGQVSLRDKLLISTPSGPLIQGVLSTPNSVWTEIAADNADTKNKSFLARGASLSSGGWVAKAATASIFAETETGFIFYFNTDLTVDTIFVPTAIYAFPAPKAKVTRTTNQSIPSGTPTPISFDLTVFGTELTDLISSPTRITVVIPGKYIVGGQITWAGGAVGRRVTFIAKNGDTAKIVAITEQEINATATQQIVVNIDSAVAGDFYELYASQTSGAPLNVTTNSINIPNMWVQYVGA